MPVPVDLRQLTPCDAMRGEDAEETASLHQMLERATAYITGFKWGPPIVEQYLGCGVGDVLALFLFRFKPPVNGTDEWLWVIEGDLPSAYFVVDDATTATKALAVYCDLMDEWASAVLKKSSLQDVFPVQAKPTKENAKMLLSRTKFIREKMIPLD